MKTTVPLICFCFFFAVSPALNAQSSVYDMPFHNPVRIAAMEPVIDMDDIAATYQTLGNTYTMEISVPGEEVMEQTGTTHISDVKAVDAVRFLEYYLEDHLLAPSSAPSGRVEMSVVYFNEDTRMNAGTLLGVLTLGIATLIGIPHSTAVSEVEVEAIFSDENRMVFATHRGHGKGRHLQIIYSSAGFRKAHQKALKQALTDLHGKILLDPRIMQRPQGIVP